MSPVSRGFTGRRRPVVDPARVPPGQYVTDDFPALSAGPTPHAPLDECSLPIPAPIHGPASRPWQLARVTELVAETSRTKSLALELPGWPGHRAGQHVDVRLTAPDGYQAQRSYSIASAPEDDGLVLTVERLADGEVSPYLVDELRPGDELELRGPIGGYFVWEEALGGPLLLLAGGSGLVPFRSMWRHRRAVRGRVPVRLLCSARSPPLLIYRDELT